MRVVVADCNDCDYDDVTIIIMTVTVTASDIRWQRQASHTAQILRSISEAAVESMQAHLAKGTSTSRLALKTVMIAVALFWTWITHRLS